MKILSIKSYLKRKNGFTMIEVLCSISMFTILFNSALRVQLDAFKIRKYNERIINYTYDIKYIKDNIIYNMSYEDIIDIWKCKRKYIELKNFSEYDDSSYDPTRLFSDKRPSGEYIEVNVEQGEILKIKLRLDAEVYGIKKSEECEFYKGNFKW